MADKQQNSAKPLRWFHVRLKTLLLGITVVGVLLAAFAAFARPYLQRRELISAITDAGGMVETRSGPKWLRSILGEENCQEVTLINLADVTPNEDILAGIAALPSLEILVLGGTELGDDALNCVPDCDSLQAVILDSTLISDDALATLRDDHPDAYIARCDRASVNLWENSSVRTHLRVDIPQRVRDRLPAEFFGEAAAFGGTYSTEAELKLLPTMHELRELRLNVVYPGLSQEDLAAIAECRKLERLVIDGLLGGSIVGVAALDELGNLQSLSLRNVTMNEDELAALTSLTELRELDLTAASVQDPGRWPRFPLEQLILDDTLIENDDLPALAQYEGLDELSLSLTEVTDAGLPSLLPLTKLRAIKLVGTRISAPSYEILCQFPNLQQVALGSAPWRKTPETPRDYDDMMRDRWVPPFGPWLDDWFFAHEVPYSDFDPATFKPSPEASDTARAALKQKLGEASLQTESPFESLHLDLLQDAAGIKKLDLSDTLTCDDDIRFIVSMPDLEVLLLGNTWITDAGVRQLVACPKLRALDLSGTAVSHAGIAELAKIKTLEELRLPRQSTRGESFRALCQLPKLRGFQLWVEDRAGRGNIAADYDVDDFSALAELLQVVLRNLDTDDNGNVTRAEYEAGGEFELLSYRPLTLNELIWNDLDLLRYTPAAETWLEQNYPEPAW